MEVASGDPIFRYRKCFSLRPGSIGFRSCEKAGAIPAGKFWSYNPRPGLDTLDSYHLRDAMPTLTAAERFQEINQELLQAFSASRQLGIHHAQT